MEPVPSRRSQAIFSTKVALLRARRGLQNGFDRLPCHPRGELREALPLAEVRVPLVSDSSPEERRYELGKIQNVRVAAARLNGTIIPAGAVFSFWRQLGRCSTRRGFVIGRQIQEGCLIPSVGGGLCLLSNAIYSAARRAGLDVIERHPHTRTVPGSLAEIGEDATVAWNHIDLRFRHDHRWRLVVRLTDSELIVAVESLGGRRPLTLLTNSGSAAPGIDPALHACGRCEQAGCPRFEPGRIALEQTLTLALDLAPEFLQMGEAGELWTLKAAPGLRFAKLKTRLAGRRAWRRDRTKAIAEMARAHVWAREIARAIPFETTHLRIDIRLLPGLQLTGALGGRSYDVLTLRPSLAALHATLDAAAEKHPERRLLRDFRAPTEIVRAERDALRGASRIVTSHSIAAACFDDRVELLPWSPAVRLTHTPGPIVLFPGPTHARKGAYEVRVAARELDTPVRTIGSELEGEEFWRGLDWRRVDVREEMFRGVLAVVQPAIAEERPRLLLQALASGVPVIATDACGLSPQPGLTIVPTSDPQALVKALQSLIRLQNVSPLACDEGVPSRVPSQTPSAR